MRLKIKYAQVVAAGVVLLCSFSAWSEEGGLGLYYNFDELLNGEIVRDISGKGNDGMAHNIELVEGKKGKALFFNGTNSCVILPPSNTVIGSNPKEGTIEFWVKPEWDPEDLPMITPAPYNFRIYYETFVCLKKKSGNQLPDGYNIIGLFQMKNTGGKGWLLGNVVPGDSMDRWVRVASPLKKGVWTHVAMIWTPEALSLYVNGERVAQNTRKFSSPDIDDFHGLVGGYQATHFHGAIDELRIIPKAIDIEDDH